MKTSRAHRRDEWLHLKALAMNGRLLTKFEIKRWQLLREEFEMSDSDKMHLKPLKVVEDQ